MDVPSGVDASVWRALETAHAQRAWVTVTLRVGEAADPTAPMRTIVGRIDRFELGAGGRPRVVLAVSDEVEQRVLVERIARVRLSTLV